jgi:uncharacterized protein YeaO (DUF488 family)
MVTAAADPPVGGARQDEGMSPRGQVRIGRIYDAATDHDGWRVLVDRLWPRGMPKERAALNQWAKEVAPTSQLRSWYGHDPARFAEFAERYRAELAGGEPGAALAELRRRLDEGDLLLLTATKDAAISAAAVLVELLRR